MLTESEVHLNSVFNVLFVRRYRINEVNSLSEQNQFKIIKIRFVQIYYLFKWKLM